MSLFSALTASASGMAAQSNKLATISDNIANANTTGYKRAMTEFESMVNRFNTTSYVAGGVASTTRNYIFEQGELNSAAASTDLAIRGNGFFLVEDSNGARFLTRAGGFYPDASGSLVNTAGFTLMGYKIDPGATSTDGTGGLSAVNVSVNDLKATASTSGTFTANLDSRATVATGNLPSANVSPATYTSKSSLVAYDNLGAAVTLDVYFTKTAANTWEATIYNAADASGTNSFPYANSALVTSTLNFSTTDGSLTTPTSLTVPVPNGQSMTLDTSHMTQLATSFSVPTATTNGHAPSTLQGVYIQSDGTMSGVYASGETIPIYKIPLANVPSPDRLEVHAGDVYQAGPNSGEMTIGTAGLGGLGSINSFMRELSTVDLATELSDMIITQRSYESNTKVFQTGSELLGTLVKMLS